MQERPTRTVPDRDADATRGLVPPTRRTPETDAMKATATARRGGGVWSWPLVRSALIRSFTKLDPRVQLRNQVMFVVAVGAVVTTVATVQQIASGDPVAGFSFQVTLWLWFTVLFANFAEAFAEARGRAQADTLRTTKRDTNTTRIRD